MTISGAAAAKRGQDAASKPPSRNAKIWRRAAPGQVHRHRQSGRQQRPDRVPGQQQARQRRRGRPCATAGTRRRRRSGRPTNARPCSSPNSRTTRRTGMQHRDRRPERRARRGAEHVRVGERVAQQPLERRPGHGQPGPDHHRGQDPRQAQVPRRSSRSPATRSTRQVQAEEAIAEDREGVAGGDRHRSRAPTPRTSATTRTRASPTPTTSGRRARPGRPTRDGGGRAGDARRRHGASGHCGVGAADGTSASGWIAAREVRRPSTRRGPGRVTMMSSIGRIAPSLTAVMTSQPGRAATARRYAVRGVAEQDDLGVGGDELLERDGEVGRARRS